MHFTSPHSVVYLYGGIYNVNISYTYAQIAAGGQLLHCALNTAEDLWSELVKILLRVPAGFEYKRDTTV